MNNSHQITNALWNQRDLRRSESLPEREYGRKTPLPAGDAVDTRPHDTDDERDKVRKSRFLRVNHIGATT